MSPAVPFPLPIFAPDSFWNTPIPEGTPTDAASDRWIRLLDDARQGKGFHLNLHNWTIPIFSADASTPRSKLHPKLLRCPLSQGHVKTLEHRLSDPHPLGLHASVRAGVPIPDEARPDSQQDAHMSVIDVSQRRAYDYWQCRVEADGSWHTNAAIAYDLYGSGVFTADDIAGIRNDESVHFYGPCRASGVPSLAGLILQEEIRSGTIRHKLAFACPVPGLQRYVSPAVWTDGWLPGGLPEGCVIQLDPALDLAKLNLAPAALVVAHALQRYGAVLVDFAGSVTLYGELLHPHPGQTWNGILGEEDLFGIPFSHFRILETGPVQVGGSHPVYHQGLSRLFYEYVERYGTKPIEELESWRAKPASP
jgi:hypothetical protein